MDQESELMTIEEFCQKWRFRVVYQGKSTSENEEVITFLCPSTKTKYMVYFSNENKTLGEVLGIAVTLDIFIPREMNIDFYKLDILTPRLQKELDKYFLS